MKTLEKRLFHLFKPADVARAREFGPATVSSPRVGQVRATVATESGEEHEVTLELSAHRRGGMTLESRCTSAAGRAGRPCASLAAVLLEVDRRGLLSGIHDQTPVSLDIIGDETDGTDDDPPDRDAEPAVTVAPVRTTATLVRQRPATGRGSPRLPPWASELE